MIYDLVGIGIGPFNLSLAALLQKSKSTRAIFCDRKPTFDWHSELMFSDAMMQTNFLTDLVTPVDPTSQFSFLNYLSENDLFYHFLNTERNYISRMEFERYCQWVAGELSPQLQFNCDVQEVTFDEGLFSVRTGQGNYSSKNICIATGHQPRIPECAKPLLGQDLFYAKSPQLSTINLTNKTVTIVGGGQTGVEIFSNMLHGKWGQPSAIRLVTGRDNLESFDVSPFTSEYFTPAYLDVFRHLSQDKKEKILAQHNLLGDGSTPSYLIKLYNDLYLKKCIEQDPCDISILASRHLIDIEKKSQGFALVLQNHVHDCIEQMNSDIVILCTGLESVIPAFMSPLFPRIQFDAAGRLTVNQSYAVDWQGPAENRIYALNFSRHQHGIIDPQTNLMAWRSAMVVNDLTGKQLYRTANKRKMFVEYGPYQGSPVTVTG